MAARSQEDVAKEKRKYKIYSFASDREVLLSTTPTVTASAAISRSTSTLATAKAATAVVVVVFAADENHSPVR